MELKHLHVFLVFSLQIFVAWNQPAPSSGKLLADIIVSIVQLCVGQLQCRKPITGSFPCM